MHTIRLGIKTRPFIKQNIIFLDSICAMFDEFNQTFQIKVSCLYILYEFFKFVPFATTADTLLDQVK